MKALALVVLAGCSFLTVSGPDTPDPTHQYTALDCDEGNGPPVIDLIAGTGAAIGAVATGVDQSLKVAAIPAAAALVLAVSAYYGFYETSKCTRLHDRAAAGGEGMACRTAADCQASLVCASQLYVRLPPELQDGGVR